MHGEQNGKPYSETVEIQGEGLLVNVDYKKRRTVIEQRYEWVHILNDFLMGVWFLAGSVFFFFKHLMAEVRTRSQVRVREIEQKN